MNFLRRLFEPEIALLRRTFQRKRRSRQKQIEAVTASTAATTKSHPTPSKADRPARQTRARRDPPLGSRIANRGRQWKPALLGALVSAVFHSLIFALLFHFNSEERPTGKKDAILVTIHLRTPARTPLRKRLPLPLADAKPKTIKIEEPIPEISQPAPLRTVETPVPNPRELEIAAAPGNSDLVAPQLRNATSESKAVLGLGAKAPPSKTGLEGALVARRGPGRATALQRYGGSTGTENAVSRGLFWLAAHQDDDGSWDADAFQRHCESFSQCFGKGKPRFTLGITGLATLAFLGAGHSPGTPSVFSDVVRKALNFLLESQGSEGNFGPMFDELFYNHAVVTLAMVEAYGIHRDPRYRRAATRALEFSARGQQAGGAWDYTPEMTGRHDLSITGWQVMALRAAQELEIAFDERMLTGVRKYLPKCVNPDGIATYANRGVAAGRKGVNMVAVGMLSQLYVGVSPNSRKILRARDRILSNPPNIERTYDWLRSFQSSYYWYTATLAMFQLGGSHWEAWNHFLQQAILPLQNRAPHENGSWEPDGNWLGVMGGRVTTTALNVLTLEVYYRYPPLHSYKTAPHDR